MLEARTNSYGLLFKNRPFRVIICLITLGAFLFSTFAQDIAWAAKGPMELTSLGSKGTGSPGSSRELNVETFSLPAYLGHVKESWFPSRRTTNDERRTTIIHIQDAHCNYAAQHRISEIIDYLNANYGVSTINLEGGAKDYNLSIFTDIADKSIREKVADYFVKEGMVSGSEYYAINNPDKVSLWGIEDTNLYLDNLNVYRESLKHKDEIDKGLKSLSYVLGSLKTKIYSKELLEFDLKYSAYKADKLEFKNYLNYLMAKARERLIDIKSFGNIYLLSQTLGEETNIDFRKANRERDALIDAIHKKLSRNALAEMVAKAVEFKQERISQDDFYAYLADKAKRQDIELANYPELQKYIVYVSMYEAIDKAKIMEEVNALEEKVKETLYKNDKDKRLAELSKTLALTKNIFNISLSIDDYRFYKAHEPDFDVKNYIKFIEKEAPLCGITARPEDGIERLDAYREDMSKFYECSFKRDKAFVKNIRLNSVIASPHSSVIARPEGPKQSQNKIAILVTGGFHTESLAELFKKNNTAYVSIMPNFKNGNGYDCPYFNLLAGKPNSAFAKIQSMLPSNLAISTFLSDPDIYGGVYGKNYRAICEVLAAWRIAIESSKYKAAIIKANGKEMALNANGDKVAVEAFKDAPVVDVDAIVQAPVTPSPVAPAILTEVEVIANNIGKWIFSDQGGRIDADAIVKKYGAKYLGSGGNGYAFKFKLLDQDIVIKFYNKGMRTQAGHESEGLKLGLGNPLFQQYISHRNEQDDSVGWVTSYYVAGENFAGPRWGIWDAMTPSQKREYYDGVTRRIMEMPDEHWDQLVRIFQYAEKNGIGVDPKPGNFLYDRNRGFVVIDYLLSKSPGRYTLNDCLIKYCYPRIIVGGHYITDKHTDLIRQKMREALDRVSRVSTTIDAPTAIAPVAPPVAGQTPAAPFLDRLGMGTGPIEGPPAGTGAHMAKETPASAINGKQPIASAGRPAAGAPVPTPQLAESEAIQTFIRFMSGLEHDQKMKYEKALLSLFAALQLRPKLNNDLALQLTLHIDSILRNVEKNEVAAVHDHILNNIGQITAAVRRVSEVSPNNPISTYPFLGWLYYDADGEALNSMVVASHMTLPDVMEAWELAIEQRPEMDQASKAVFSSIFFKRALDRGYPYPLAPDLTKFAALMSPEDITFDGRSYRIKEIGRIDQVSEGKSPIVMLTLGSAGMPDKKVLCKWVTGEYQIDNDAIATGIMKSLFSDLVAPYAVASWQSVPGQTSCWELVEYLDKKSYVIWSNEDGNAEKRMMALGTIFAVEYALDARDCLWRHIFQSADGRIFRIDWEFMLDFDSRINYKQPPTLYGIGNLHNNEYGLLSEIASQPDAEALLKAVRSGYNTAMKRLRENNSILRSLLGERSYLMPKIMSRVDSEIELEISSKSVIAKALESIGLPQAVPPTGTGANMVKETPTALQDSGTAASESKVADAFKELFGRDIVGDINAMLKGFEERGREVPADWRWAREHSAEILMLLARLNREAPDIMQLKEDQRMKYPVYVRLRKINNYLELLRFCELQRHAEHIKREEAARKEIPEKLKELLAGAGAEREKAELAQAEIIAVLEAVRYEGAMYRMVENSALNALVRKLGVAIGLPRAKIVEALKKVVEENIPKIGAVQLVETQKDIVMLNSFMAQLTGMLREEITENEKLINFIPVDPVPKQIFATHATQPEYVALMAVLGFMGKAQAEKAVGQRISARSGGALNSVSFQVGSVARLFGSEYNPYGFYHPDHYDYVRQGYGYFKEFEPRDGGEFGVFIPFDDIVRMKDDHDLRIYSDGRWSPDYQRFFRRKIIELGYAGAVKSMREIQQDADYLDRMTPRGFNGLRDAVREWRAAGVLPTGRDPWLLEYAGAGEHQGEIEVYPFKSGRSIAGRPDGIDIRENNGFIMVPRAKLSEFINMMIELAKKNGRENRLQESLLLVCPYSETNLQLAMLALEQKGLDKVRQMANAEVMAAWRSLIGVRAEEITSGEPVLVPSPAAPPAGTAANMAKAPAAVPIPGTPTPEVVDEIPVRDVKNIIERYNCVFVHGFALNFASQSNGMIDANLDWETKLKIAAGFHPALSSSTIRAGNRRENIWSSIGVILNGGSVSSASPGDAGTYATSVGKRTDHRQHPENIAKEIDIAVEGINNPNDGYNELVVESPAVVGIYISLDAYNASRDIATKGGVVKTGTIWTDLIPMKKVHEVSSRLSIPLYVIEKGEVYEAGYDEAKGEIYRKGNPITPQDILRKQPIQQSIEASIRQELLEDSPFKINPWEVSCIDTWNEGRERYIRFNALFNTDEFRRKHTLRAAPEGWQSSLVAEIRIRNFIVRYWITDDKSVFRQVLKRDGEESETSWPVQWGSDITNMGITRGGVYVAGYFFKQKAMDYKDSISSNKEYLDIMKFLLNEYVKKGKELEYAATLLGFNLYGFGEQAGEFGDADTKREAFQIIKDELGEGQFGRIEEVRKRRVGEKGGFRTTVEELIQIGVIKEPVVLPMPAPAAPPAVASASVGSGVALAGRPAAKRPVDTTDDMKFLGGGPNIFIDIACLLSKKPRNAYFNPNGGTKWFMVWKDIMGGLIRLVRGKKAVIELRSVVSEMRRDFALNRTEAMLSWDEALRHAILANPTSVISQIMLQEGLDKPDDIIFTLGVALEHAMVEAPIIVMPAAIDAMERVQNLHGRQFIADYIGGVIHAAYVSGERFAPDSYETSECREMFDIIINKTLATEDPDVRRLLSLVVSNFLNADDKVSPTARNAIIKAHAKDLAKLLPNTFRKSAASPEGTGANMTKGPAAQPVAGQAPEKPLFNQGTFRIAKEKDVPRITDLYELIKYGPDGGHLDLGERDVREESYRNIIKSGNKYQRIWVWCDADGKVQAYFHVEIGKEKDYWDIEFSHMAVEQDEKIAHKGIASGMWQRVMEETQKEYGREKIHYHGTTANPYIANLNALPEYSRHGSRLDPGIAKRKFGFNVAEGQSPGEPLRFSFWKDVPAATPVAPAVPPQAQPPQGMPPVLATPAVTPSNEAVGFVVNNYSFSISEEGMPKGIRVNIFDETLHMLVDKLYLFNGNIIGTLSNIIVLERKYPGILDKLFRAATLEESRNIFEKILRDYNGYRNAYEAAVSGSTTPYDRYVKVLNGLSNKPDTPEWKAAVFCVISNVNPRLAVEFRIDDFRAIVRFEIPELGGKPSPIAVFDQQKWEDGIGARLNMASDVFGLSAVSYGILQYVTGDNTDPDYKGYTLAFTTPDSALHSSMHQEFNNIASGAENILQFRALSELYAYSSDKITWDARYNRIWASFRMMGYDEEVRAALGKIEQITKMANGIEKKLGEASALTAFRNAVLMSAFSDNGFDRLSGILSIMAELDNAAQALAILEGFRAKVSAGGLSFTDKRTLADEAAELIKQLVATRPPAPPDSTGAHMVKEAQPTLTGEPDFAQKLNEILEKSKREPVEMIREMGEWAIPLLRDNPDQVKAINKILKDIHDNYPEKSPERAMLESSLRAVLEMEGLGDIVQAQLNVVVQFVKREQLDMALNQTGKVSRAINKPGNELIARSLIGEFTEDEVKMKDEMTKILRQAIMEMDKAPNPKEARALIYLPESLQEAFEKIKREIKLEDSRIRVQLIDQGDNPDAMTQFMLGIAITDFIRACDLGKAEIDKPTPTLVSMLSAFADGQDPFEILKKLFDKEFHLLIARKIDWDKEDNKRRAWEAVRQSL